MVSLCNRVQKKDREHCILSIHTIFENMHTARYLDFIQDIDLFIKKEVIKKVGEVHEGFVFGGSDMYHNSLQFTPSMPILFGHVVLFGLKFLYRL